MTNEFWESLSKGEKKVAGTLALIWLGFTMIVILWLARVIAPSPEQGFYIFFGGTFSFVLFAAYMKYLNGKTIMMLKKELQDKKAWK